MSARTVIRATVVLLLGSLAVPALTSPGAAGQAPPEVTVSVRGICGEVQADDQIEITIVNPGTQTYQVEILATTYGNGPVTETTQLTLDPGETETVVLDVVSTPMDVSVVGDGDFPDQELGPVFHCPALIEVTLSTTVDTPVEFVDPCINTGDFDMPHGRVEPVPNTIPERLRYIPDPGFVGVDDHTISCVTSSESNARIVVTVSAAQAPPAEPVPEAPTFTG
jgi:hypothetical protein